MKSITPMNNLKPLKVNDIVQLDPEKVAKPLYTFKQIQDYMLNSHCLTCGGHHGIFNGRAVQCADLQAGFCHGLPIHKVTS